MKLRDDRARAHRRQGDIVNISLIALRRDDYPRLVAAGDGRAGQASASPAWSPGDVDRYELPSIGALNFVLHGVVGGGVTRTLALDAHGKSLSSVLLEMEIPDEDRSSGSDRSQCCSGRGGWRPRRAARRSSRLEITSREPMTNGGKPVGAAGPFEILRGRIHGEIDPNDPHNAIIQDLAARAAQRARARSSTSPPSRWPSRSIWRKPRACCSIRSSTAATGQATPAPRATSRSSAAGRGTSSRPRRNQTIVVPIAQAADGSPVTGPVLARFFDVPGGDQRPSRSA